MTVGAARTTQYIPQLKGKRVALFSNHTGMVGDSHTLDVLLGEGVEGGDSSRPNMASAALPMPGEHVASSVDLVTGIPIASLYGGKNKRMPSKDIMDDLDVIVCDIQDVGLRYYTYYCTMVDLMNAAKAYGKEFMVLDRPNPNGMYVDGPILDMKYKSGVGRLPIPVVHGLTLGELARMANGEGWLTDGGKVKLTVVPCEGYTHATRYRLPIAPSPNLRDMKAIYLYPSVCFFEATPVSLGRGTDFPFTVYGHPDMKGRTFEFTPRSVPGAKNPPQLDRLCHGVDLRGLHPTLPLPQRRTHHRCSSSMTKAATHISGNNSWRCVRWPPAINGATRTMQLTTTAYTPTRASREKHDCERHPGSSSSHCSAAWYHARHFFLDRTVSRCPRQSGRTAGLVAFRCRRCLSVVRNTLFVLSAAAACSAAGNRLFSLPSTPSTSFRPTDTTCLRRTRKGRCISPYPVIMVLIRQRSLSERGRALSTPSIPATSLTYGPILGLFVGMAHKRVGYTTASYPWCACAYGLTVGLPVELRAAFIAGFELLLHPAPPSPP